MRISVDETSHKGSRKYMAAVVDHGAYRAVWCNKGHGKAAFESGFSQLTGGQRAPIKAVTADGAGWTANIAAAHCPNIEHVMDPSMRVVDG